MLLVGVVCSILVSIIYDGAFNVFNYYEDHAVYELRQIILIITNISIIIVIVITYTFHVLTIHNNHTH